MDPLVTATDNELPTLICNMASQGELINLKKSFKKGIELDISD